jgi:hypothetical protein
MPTDDRPHKPSAAEQAIAWCNDDKLRNGTPPEKRLVDGTNKILATTAPMHDDVPPPFCARCGCGTQRDKNGDCLRCMTASPGKLELRYYTVGLLIAIDGHLQAEECAVDVRYGPDATRVYVRWAIPSSGMEWDGRDQVGTTHRIVVYRNGGHGGTNDIMQARDMRCIWFACGHSVRGSRETIARAIFECPARVTVAPMEPRHNEQPVAAAVAGTPPEYYYGPKGKP